MNHGDCCYMTKTCLEECLDRRYTREIPEPALPWFQHGAQIGGLWGFFPAFKITAVCQVRNAYHLHLLRSEREDKTRVKHRTARKDRGCIGFAFAFACVVGKNPKTPNLSPMADDAITQGGIGGLGSPVYIYGLDSIWSNFVYQSNATKHRLK